MRASVALPTVTVLLPAYNAAAWLQAAVDSVLTQSFRDFELLVIDDGSKDATAEVLAAYSDPRIRIVRHETNLGLVAALNHGIDLAKGKYIARMDADDVAHARRLERQVEFLEKYHDVGICGTWFRTVGLDRASHSRPPTDHDEISALLFFRSAFGHPTVMFRRALLEHAGLRYDTLARHAEDFDLWVRARERTRFANLPKYLLDYRMHASQTSAEHLQPQLEAASRIRLNQLAIMVPDCSEAQKRLHLRACDGHVFSNSSDLLEARSWLDLLQDANRRRAIFPPRAFGQALASAWAHCCYRASFARRDLFPIFVSRRYSHIGFQMLRQHAGFAYRALRGH